ncbi:UNVERIFIED_CONTAM: hypothetical protein GTU68_007653 [Idotea baltica]|nr:hypothetical protein [Idotea baltica]
MVIVSIVGNVLALTLGNAIGGIVSIALMIFSLGSLLPGIAVAIRRMHDIDKPALWVLIGLIPLVGGFILIYFFVQEGTKGPNQYGADPKGGAADIIG